MHLDITFIQIPRKRNRVAQQQKTTDYDDMLTYDDVSTYDDVLMLDKILKLLKKDPKPDYKLFEK